MTDVKEFSDSILAIDYRRSWIDRICHLAAGISSLATVVIILSPDVDLTPVKGHEAFVAPFLIILVIGLLASAFWFLSQVFDRISYDFDKKADAFQISGRSYLYKKIKIEGAVSEILAVSCEIYGRDEGTNSEIFLTHRYLGSVKETVKCGTRDDVEDVHIAECIEMFLKPAIKN